MSGAKQGKLGVGKNGRAGARITLTIEAGQLADLEHEAERLDRSVSWCVREAVAAWLAAQEDGAERNALASVSLAAQGDA